MIVIKSDSYNPYFNIASEEYFIKNFDEDIFLLYRNDNTIVVGKHQNTISEINADYVERKGIDVVRRQSGGGAVFHDLGNLNFCFIKNMTETVVADFKSFTEPILEVLRELEVNAKFEGRNDLTIDGKKFSGNAEYIDKENNRVLHHGTLLFTSEMKDLSQALKVNPLKFKDKAVKSVRSRVTNISSHLKKVLSLEDFTEKIIKHVTKDIPESKIYTLTDDDRKNIQKLADEKYSSWDWVYGKNAKYDFEKLFKTTGGTIEVHFNVREGIITDAKIFGDFFGENPIIELEKTLIGAKHNFDDMESVLEKIDFEKYIKNTTVEEFVRNAI
jgi:lipoate-protein ligase A